MLLTETCYYIENQVFGGATNRDMSLIETCFYSQLYGNYLQISKWLLRNRSLFLNFLYLFYDFIFYKSYVRTVLLEVGIVLRLLKKVT